jgi:hypothetical protein
MDGPRLAGIHCADQPLQLRTHTTGSGLFRPSRDDTLIPQTVVQRTKSGRFGRSVRLAAQVVPWHTFNFIGFRPVNFEASHTKYQGCCCQAETLGLLRCGIDFLGQALTFTWVCHSCSSPKVRDEKSHICCRATEKTRSSIERNLGKPAAVEGLPQTCTRPAFRNHRTGRTFCD